MGRYHHQARIINIYYRQRIAQNVIEKTAIFAPEIWCLQAGNSKMVTYFIFLQPLLALLGKELGVHLTQNKILHLLRLVPYQSVAIYQFSVFEF